MANTIRPLGDRLLVKNVDLQNVTNSGLILTSDKKDLPQIATVIQVSDQIKNQELDDDCPYTVQVGQRIIYNKYAGTDITLQGEDYVILRLKDVLAVAFA